jgi:hypothetical protein
MDNRTRPEPYEIPADSPGCSIYARVVAGVCLGTLAFAAIVVAWLL